MSLLQTVNPNNVPGRVAVITRMGEKGMRRCLPGLIQAVQEAGQIVTWVTDPMHGNTESCGRFKTRQYENIRAEIEAFFDVHEEMGTVPGGIHLEMTGENVTECIGGGAQVRGHGGTWRGGLGHSLETSVAHGWWDRTVSLGPVWLGAGGTGLA